MGRLGYLAEAVARYWTRSESSRKVADVPRDTSLIARLAHVPCGPLYESHTSPDRTQNPPRRAAAVAWWSAVGLCVDEEISF